MMTDDWVKKVDIDVLECSKKMFMLGKQLRQKETREYESQSLQTPFRIIALIINKIFGHANEPLYKLSWIPLIYYIAFEGTMFDWEDIISDSFSSCIAVAQGGITQKISEFYMSFYLIDCILCRHPFAKLGCIWT